MEIIQKDRTYVIRVRDIGDVWAYGKNMEIKDGVLILNGFILKNIYSVYTESSGRNLILCYGEEVPGQVSFPLSNLVGITLLDKNQRPLWVREKK